MILNPCSCGCSEAHRIARRTTTDGMALALWSDGALTWPLGIRVKGSPEPRTLEGCRKALVAGWLVMGEVSLYEGAEVTDLVKAARWVADRDGKVSTMRERLHKPFSIRPDWKVIQTDRDGKATVRAWVLPRMRPEWAGLCLWDETSPGGRYTLLRRMRSGLHADQAYASTGFQFGSIQAAVAHLRDLLDHVDLAG